MANHVDIDPFLQITDESLEKYKTAGIIAKRTVDLIVQQAKPGTKLTDLITVANKFVNTELMASYPDIKNKGLSFPICLSPNNIAGHYIPLPNCNIELVPNSILKIELGVHIDGYHANIGFSTLVIEPGTKYLLESNDPGNKKRNVMLACIGASREILELMTPGKTNMDVQKTMTTYAEKHGCNLPISNERGFIPGVFSFQISRYIQDGYNDDTPETEFIHRFIESRANPAINDFAMVENEFEKDEVYCIDVVMSSGTGRLNSGDELTTVYARNHEVSKPLRLQASKKVLNTLKNSRFAQTIDMTDPANKMGLHECLKNNVVKKYTVVCEKDDEYVARIKFTVLVKDNPFLICAKSANDELEKLK